tara:strand:- start:70 stop:537 length:468 start_codon:yes stop_codon:yes gene_type:complete
MEYVSAPSMEKDSDIFIEKLELGDDQKALILFRSKNSFIIMNLFPYNNGHLLIAPYEQVSELDKLDENTTFEMFQLANRSITIIKKVMKADGFNVGFNIGESAGAGIADHIHLHVVPRWSGDTNFMPVLGNTKVMVQSLEDSYQMLKPYFDEIQL